MTDAIEVKTKLEELAKEIQSTFDTLNNELSYYDLQEQDILHMIESSKLNAIQISKAIKKLKEIRAARREVKNNLILYTSLREQFKKTDINLPKIPDKYVVRTDVLKEFGISKDDKVTWGK